MKFRRALPVVLASSCTLSLALAQEPTPDEGPAGELKTVIVTGEKTGRSLLDTATSATVLDARALERRAGLSTTKDILQSTSNLLVVGTGNQAPTVRGVDGTGAAKGADALSPSTPCRSVAATTISGAIQASSAAPSSMTP